MTAGGCSSDQGSAEIKQNGIQAENGLQARVGLEQAHWVGSDGQMGCWSGLEHGINRVYDPFFFHFPNIFLSLLFPLPSNLCSLSSPLFSSPTRMGWSSGGGAVVSRLRRRRRREKALFLTFFLLSLILFTSLIQFSLTNSQITIKMPQI